MIVVVMGVSGAGKTTVGRLIATALNARFIEGDTFHPKANVDKMRRGLPLDDADRGPWLAALAEALNGYVSRGETVVLACSALKRAYRNALRAGAPQARFVYLKGDQGQIAARLKERKGHYMPATLLASQFAALEEPAVDEGAIVADITDSPTAIARYAVDALGIAPSDPVA
ncbi:MAG TPA: gluconokinase [Alphaproteobacteria bacterium]|nr:gluconokinase [Alphaproteobacteria bacterium]